MADQAEVVVHPGLEFQLLERRDLDVMRRLRERDRRRPVARHIHDDLGLERVGPAFGVNELHRIAFRVRERHLRPVGVRLGLVADERDGLALLVEQRGRGDVLVEPADQRQLGPLDGGHVPDVLDDLGGERRVGREDEVSVGPLQFGILEDADAETGGGPPVELNPVGEVGLDRVDSAGERRILEAAHHRATGRALEVAVEDEGGIRRRVAVETGDDQERAAALELDVAGIDLDLGGVRQQAAARAAVGRRARLQRQGADHDDEEDQAGGVGELGRAEQPGGDGLVPVVGLPVFERLADHGRLEEAEPAARGGLDLVDGGEQLRAQVGVAGLDPAGDPARVAGRPDGRQDADHPQHRGQERHRAGDPRGRDPGHAGQGAEPDDRAAGERQRQPAGRQPAPEPDASESLRDLFQCLPQSSTHDDRASAWA